MRITKQQAKKAERSAAWDAMTIIVSNWRSWSKKLEDPFALEITQENRERMRKNEVPKPPIPEGIDADKFPQLHRLVKDYEKKRTDENRRYLKKGCSPRFKHDPKRMPPGFLDYMTIESFIKANGEHVRWFLWHKPGREKWGIAQYRYGRWPAFWLLAKLSIKVKRERDGE